MNIANAIAVSFTFSILFTGLTAKRDFAVFLRIFITSATMYMIFLILGITSYLNLPLALFVTFIGKEADKPYLHTVFKSFTAMTMLTLFVTTLGSLFFAFLPNFMQSAEFDFLMSFLSIVFGLFVFMVIKKKGLLVKFNKIFNHSGLLKKCIAAEVALLALISLILPLVLAVSRNNFMFSLYYAMFSVSAVFIAYLTYQLMTAETKIIYAEQLKRFEEINGRLIKEKYNDIIGLTHYYNKLYEMLGGYIASEDWQGLESYFNKYIQPLHKEHIKSGFVLPKLDLVEMKLIKNLLFDAAVKARYVYNTEILIDIDGCITLGYMHEMDLFIILNEWLSNAFRAIEGKGGYIHILLACSTCSACSDFSDFDEILTIKVTNPIFEEIDIGSMYDLGYTTKDGHAGVGLAHVRSIINSYENAESMTYIELEKLVQLLVIKGRGYGGV